MAISHADVGATELANLALDYALLIGRNWARSCPTGWPRWTTDGHNASADQAATGGSYDSALAVDDYEHAYTKPNAAATTWYFNLDLGSAQGEIDCFALLGHNLNTIGATLTLQVADDSNFSVNVRDIYVVTPASNKRLCTLVIKEAGDPNPQRYTSVEFARLKIVGGGAVTPQISEVWLGRRRQLYFPPNLVFDPDNMASAVIDSEGLTGIASTSILYVSRRALDYSYIVKDSTAISDFRAFWLTDTNGSTLPFLYVEHPSSAPTDAWYMRFTHKILEGKSQGFGERRYKIQAIEHGKNLLAAGI